MENPKTRRESKKDPKEKGEGKGPYSAKHIRLMETFKEKQRK
jgi:hypothetical protein